MCDSREGGTCIEHVFWNSPPGSSVHRILQARILEWVVISFYRESCQSRDESMSLASPALAGRFLTTGPPGKSHNLVFARPWDSPGKNTGVGCHFLLQCRKVKSESEVTQSCLTLCNPMDYSLPGSSIHGMPKNVQTTTQLHSFHTLAK